MTTPSKVSSEISSQNNSNIISYSSKNDSSLSSDSKPVSKLEGKARSPLILGVSGASGMIYAVRALKHLLAADYSVELVASRASQQVWQQEHGTPMPTNLEQQQIWWREQAGVSELGQLTCHAWGNVGAGIASGSYRALGMVIMPCSMSTVGKIAAGLSSDLLERAADVQIKEGRSLVVVPRETPLSLIHLRNLTTLAESGVRIVPAVPAWYHRPQTIDDLVDFVVARALDQLAIDCVPLRRWKDGGFEPCPD